MPESWKDLYDCDIYREDYETGYTICFYEKESRKVIEGGYLFGISLYEEGVDYSFLPSFDELGQIQTYSKTYEVIVEYPTDVQFNEDTADLYHQLSDQIDDILGTIEAKKGCQYIKNNKSSVYQAGLLFIVDVSNIHIQEFLDFLYSKAFHVFQNNQ